MKAGARVLTVVLVAGLSLSASLLRPGRSNLPIAAAQTGGPSTTRVSVSTAGQEGNGASEQPSISGDGRYIAFRSAAASLVAGDSNHVNDIFVRDQTAQTTIRISLSSSGKQGNGASASPDIASQGRYVTFQSDASNLVSGDRNGAKDIFVRDLTTNTTSRVSLASSGGEGNGASQYPSVSADGRYVAFLSSASNLVTGDSNGVDDVFVRDAVSGTTARVSISSSGTQANGASSAPPAISGDGRYVAFASSASNLVPGDANGITDIFVHDRTTGTTTRVSLSSFGEEANSGSSNPVISSDGRYVAFDSAASNLVPNDLNHWTDIFIHELSSGRTTRVSVTSDGTEADSASGDPAISADGRYVAFWSAATNLATSDTNGAYDVFLHDVTTETTERTSVSSTGSGGSRRSEAADVSGDGRYVTFQSDSPNLVSGDTNNYTDAFVRDRGAQSGAPAVVVDEPGKDDRVFGSQTIAATVDESFSATSVDFLIDSAVVGSDATVPYSIQWDSTTVPDGEHAITAKAIAAGGAISQSNAVSVSVINGTGCDDRLEADFDAGRINVDAFAKNGIYCLVEPSLLPARDVSSAQPQNTEDDYYEFEAHWNELSQATKDEINQFFADVDRGFYWTLGGTSAASQKQATQETAASITQAEGPCVTLVGRFGFTARRCTYSTSLFEISYTEEPYDNGVPITDNNGINDGDGIPDRIETIEDSLKAALERYTNSGVVDHPGISSSLSFRVPDLPIKVVLGHHPMQSGAAGFAPICLPFASDIYLDPTDPGIYLPRHELFHVIQWKYASCDDWRTKLGTRMWAEATAEWAADESLPSGEFRETDRYADDLDMFFAYPYFNLSTSNTFWDAIFDTGFGHEYGAFILAKYLEEQFGGSPPFIRRSWERIADPDSLGAIGAIDSLLRNEEGQPDGLAGVLSDFWQRNYLLRQNPPYADLSYSDPDVPDWRLSLNGNYLTEGDGSAATSVDRPARSDLRLTGGRYLSTYTSPEAGGADFVDLVHDFGRPMTLRLKVANRTLQGSLTSDDIRLTLFSFDNYPHLCRQPLDLTLANGVALPPPVQLDASCRFSTLVVTNSDAIAGQPMIQEVAAKVDGAPAPGDVFVSVKNGFVQIYRPDGTLISMWDTGRSGEIAGSAFDAAGNFYAPAFDWSSIRKFAPDGTLLGDWGSGYASYPESILFDASGNAYVGNVGGPYPFISGSIQKRAPDGALLKSFSVELQRRGADFIALRPDGCTMLYTSEGTRILQYDVCADQQLSDFNTDTLNIKFAINVLPNGGAIAAANYGINRYDAQGHLVQTYDHVAPLNEWFALALDPDGTSFWAGDATTGEVARFDLSTGNKLTSFLTGFTSPPTSGESAVGGISIRPNFGGAMSQQAMRTTLWGFDAPSPGQPHRTDPIEEVETE